MAFEDGDSYDHALVEAIGAGRQAGQLLTGLDTVLDEFTDAVLRNAIAAFRRGELDPTRALMAIAKIDALAGLRDELETRVDRGERAAELARKPDPEVE